MSTTRRADAASQPGPPDGEAEATAGGGVGGADAPEDVARALIARYIVPGPEGRGPADARLGGYGTPVWALVGYFFRAAAADAALVAADYDVPVEAVRAALVYYAAHQREIDARLTLNDAS
jgi:uncharacterized protein (DUF433 family)